MATNNNSANLLVVQAKALHSKKGKRQIHLVNLKKETHE